MKIWFQNHRYKTKKAIQEKGMDIWSSAAAAAAAAAYSPRRVLVRDGPAGGYPGSGGLTAKQEAALLAQAHLVGLGAPQHPHHHFPFPPLHHFPHLLMPPPPGPPTSSSSSLLPPPSSSLLSAFGQNLKASGSSGSSKLW